MRIRHDVCIAFVSGFLLCASVQCAEPEFIIQIRDHKFIPAELSVPVGTKVRIVLDNQQETPEEFESYSLHREKHIPPKSRVTLFIGPLDPGRYVYEGENDVGSGGAALGIIVAQ